MRRASPTNTEGPTAIVRSEPTYYSLWDVDSGNSLGTYDTREDALQVMRLLIDDNGSEYAEYLDLSHIDEFGHEVHVGTGTSLQPELAQNRNRRAN
ncbi:MAG: hypothetical protein ACRDJH_17840 [Thermomicrobiales bacterium]